MGYFGGYFGGGSSGEGGEWPSFPSISNAATAGSIRDRIYALIEAITPDTLSSDEFRRSRNEEGADFEAWAEKTPGAAFRRFQVRRTGDDELPLTSSVTSERVRVRFEIRVAYPQNHRYGRGNAMDRDDVMDEDWLRIDFRIGICGRGNFSGSHDCTPLGATKTRESGGKVDYLVVTAEYEYVRSTT